MSTFRLYRLLGYSNTKIDFERKRILSSYHFDTIRYSYTDINRNSIADTIQLTIERLQPSSEARLQPGISGVNNVDILDVEGDDNEPGEIHTSGWKVAEVAYSTKVVSREAPKAGTVVYNQVLLPQLPAGVYCIRLKCGDAQVEDTRLYLPEDATSVPITELLYVDIDKVAAEVGDTITLRIGTPYHDVTTYCHLYTANDKTPEVRIINIDSGIVHYPIAITKDMESGLGVGVFSFKNGAYHEFTQSVIILNHQKELEVQFETFRDKITSGDTETWRLKVLDSKTHLPRPAALVMTMFDSTLNQLHYPMHYGLSFWGYYSTYPFWENFVEEERGENVDRGKKFNASNSLNPGMCSIANTHCIRAIPTITVGTCSSGSRSRNRNYTYTAVSIAEKPDPDYDEYREIIAEPNTQWMPNTRGEDGMVRAVGGVGYSNEKSANVIQPRLRSNLSTLAFFEPKLTTDSNGMLTYSFKVPDLLTTWEILGVAWTKDMTNTTFSKSLVTQKLLMVQPNMPRFLRQGDDAELLAKVSNLTDSAIETTVEFTFQIDSTMQTGKKQITVPAHSTQPVSFPVKVDDGATVATYKIVAFSARHSDGETGQLPILSNRQAVTHSVSMYMNGAGEKTYQLPLTESSTAEPLSITVEYTPNPSMLAIQTLPYMEQQKDPSSITLFNSYYINSLGSIIAQQHPELRHLADSIVPSPLQRNEDIKQTLLSETPWLNNAESENERLRRVAKFYDAEQLQQQIQESYDQLAKAQNTDGGWSWMPEGKTSSDYVTQYIMQGLGKMAYMMEDDPSKLTRKALSYIDETAYKLYVQDSASKKSSARYAFYPTHLDYLYTRSFFPKMKLTKKHQGAYDYYYAKVKKDNLSYTDLYSQAILAQVFYRHGDTLLAKEMLDRMKQKSIIDDEQGMYWRDNISGYFNYQRPVENQALAIEAFREVMPEDTLSIGLMQQWLLKQRQTTTWATSTATLRAIMALQGSNSKGVTHVQINLLNKSIEGSDYVHQTFPSEVLKSVLPAHTTSTPIVLRGEEGGMSWGAAYYQYTEQMDKIASSSTGIKLQRHIYRINTNGSRTEITTKHKATLHVGDRVCVELTFSTDRTIEYLQMKNLRASCLEPVSTRSGWRWSDGLSYYNSINNSYDAMYVDHLDKGRYVITTEYYVTNPGSFTLAPSVLQCMYSPEFRATSSGTTLNVEE